MRHTSHSCPVLLVVRRTSLRYHRRAGWLSMVVGVCVYLSGCSGGPHHPVVPPSSTAVTTSSAPTPSPPNPSFPSPAIGSASGVGSGSATGSEATTTAVQGAVVPFRTVAQNSATGKRIGLVAATGSDPFAKAVTDSVIAQVKVAGATLIRCDPGGDASLVLACARRMATEHVDGWIALPTGDLGESLCQAGPRDVPLIVIAAAPISCQKAELGADDRQAGFLVGMELGRASRIRYGCKQNALVIVTNSAAKMVSDRRVDGIRAGFTDQCPGPITDELLLDAGTQDHAYESFTAALTALPDSADIVVAAVNDGAALGVQAAIPDPRADHITLAAVGADQRARCAILADPHWIGDAALFPDRYGDVAVPALLDALRGQSIPPSMYVQTTFVTAKTLGDYYDAADCPAK